MTRLCFGGTALNQFNHLCMKKGGICSIHTNFGVTFVRLAVSSLRSYNSTTSNLDVFCLFFVHTSSCDVLFSAQCYLDIVL